MKSAITSLKRWVTSCGSAHWHETCGLCLRVELRSVTTQLQIFSSSFNRCNWNSTSRSWRGGQSWRGQSRTRGIDSTLSTFKPIWRWSLNLLVAWSQSINAYYTHTEFPNVNFSSLSSSASLKPSFGMCLVCIHFSISMKVFYCFDLQKKKKKKVSNSRQFVHFMYTIFHWIFSTLYIQHIKHIQNFLQIHTICTSNVHNFPLNLTILYIQPLQRI